MNRALSALALTACAAGAGQARRTLPDEPLTCQPAPPELQDSSRSSPSRGEALYQITRVAPHVAACTRDAVSSPHVSVQFWIAGATGDVTRVAAASVSGDVAQCIAAKFAGVCFVPFEVPEFTVKFPFKTR